MAIRMMPIMPAGFTLQGSTALDQIDDQNDDSDHQENMNESAHGVGAHQSQKPQNEQNYKDSPKHTIVLSVEFNLASCGAGQLRLSHRLFGLYF
jgi:hypothetical protein